MTLNASEQCCSLPVWSIHHAALSTSGKECTMLPQSAAVPSLFIIQTANEVGALRMHTAPRLSILCQIVLLAKQTRAQANSLTWCLASVADTAFCCSSTCCCSLQTAG